VCCARPGGRLPVFCDEACEPNLRKPCEGADYSLRWCQILGAPRDWLVIGRLISPGRAFPAHLGKCALRVNIAGFLRDAQRVVCCNLCLAPRERITSLVDNLEKSYASENRLRKCQRAWSSQYPQTLAYQLVANRSEPCFRHCALRSANKNRHPETPTTLMLNTNKFLTRKLQQRPRSPVVAP
jgi:hypothetical protein